MKPEPVPSAVHVTVAVPNPPVLTIVNESDVNPERGSEIDGEREAEEKLMFPLAAENETTPFAEDTKPIEGEVGVTNGITNENTK